MDRFEMIAAVVALDGSRIIRASGAGAWRDADQIGRGLGARLLDEGAGEILDEARTVDS
jgi:hydroxymethylbilane synthase